MSKKLTRKQLVWRWVKIGLGIAAAVFLVIVGIVLIWASRLRLPDFDNFDAVKVVQSTKIYDRTGEIVLYDANRDVKRTVVDAGDISPYAKNAIVAIEDDTFYQHNGIDARGLVRAILVNLRSRELAQGGSTITQQVVKNTLLTQEKKISRKIKEWVLALKLDQAKSKDEILALYLNGIPYGGRIYGIQEASQTFFAKDPHELTLAESAYLAAIPNAPTFYSPYGNNVDRLEVRKNLVLERMLELDFISQSEHDDAADDTVEFLVRPDVSSKALHFVQYILEELEERYGADMVENGGLKVYTTLDYELQAKAEEIVKKHALENAELYNASNSALVALDPRTGEILTMVGSRDYFDTEIDGNFNVVVAQRQPGSSFKPFVYVTAFKKGYTTETVMFDTQTQFNPSCGAFNFSSNGNCYAPQNYDGVYDGPITLRRALGSSRNVPAVKLLYLVGVPDAIRTASDLGITGLGDASRYGLTLVLGGGEVRLLDMATAYGTLANDGVRVETHGIIRVEDMSGNVIYEPTASAQRVIDANPTRMLNDVLSDNQARSGLFSNPNNVMYFPNQDVAGKTGTTNDNRDAWMMGYTPNLVVGVWSGNNDNSSMKKGSAISAATWREFMNTALPSRPKDSFIEPDLLLEDTKPIMQGIWQGGEAYEIDTISGGRATDLTPAETRKTIVITNPHSELFWIDKRDPRGPAPNNPSSDNQYDNWEASVRAWINRNPVTSVVTSASIPTFNDNVHTAANRPTVSFAIPGGTTVSASQSITVTPTITANYPVIRADYYINGAFVGSSTSGSFSYTFTPGDYIQSGSATIRVVGVDGIYNRGSSERTITIQ